MRKTLLTFLCVVVACLVSQAQGIKFEKGTWEEVQAKAKAENKTVFVDVYTTWCGPCKHVAKEVFPQEKLGEFYNPRFICYQIDAESPEGKKFVEKHPITGVPTFFFIATDGSVYHSFSGARDVNGFISEAKMVSMYERYGGSEKMMEAVKNGTADQALLRDYYESANEDNKPAALNLYLKSFQGADLIDLKNVKLISGISLYDKELMTRFVDEIVKISHTDKYQDKSFVGNFNFDIVFPIQRDLNKFINQSIEQCNVQQFKELLELRKRFDAYSKSSYDGDLNIKRGRGIFFATTDYMKLCFWSKNRLFEQDFKQLMTSYMGKMIAENHVDSLLKVNQNRTLKMVKEAGVSGRMAFFAQFVIDKGNVSCCNIIDWTDYFWRISPSDKKTKELCTQWISYAFNLNPYNARPALPAADVLARIGNYKEATAILKKALECQKELKNEKSKIFRDLELKLRDIENRKI